MIFLVMFEDNENAGDKRTEHMQAHLDFLSRHADTVAAAGPLTDTADGTAAGGAWLVDCPRPEAVHALIQEDPFWPTGLRKSVRVLSWQQVFADGQRLI